jgi:hypothetical protein
MIVLKKVCGCGTPYEVLLKKDRKWEQAGLRGLRTPILESDRTCGLCDPPQENREDSRNVYYTISVSADFNLDAEKIQEYLRLLVESEHLVF